MINSINVFLHDTFAGELRVDQEGALSYKYADRYVRESGIPISLSMPLRLEYSYRDESEAYFQGLLPEGSQKLAMALAMKISPSDHLSMLGALGKDCLGAISITEESNSSKLQFKQLTAGTLEALVNSKTSLQPLLFANENVRSALPEVQSAAPLTIVGNDLFLPIDGAPSNVILRPQGTVQYSNLNRYATKLLARRVGIDIPTFKILRVDEGTAILEYRADRFWENGAITRSHVESFGQALSAVPTEIFERQGGPGFVECIGLINEKFPIPARDIDRFVRMFLFNILIGYCDANAGSFTISHDEKGPRVAGASGIMCTLLNDSQLTDLGMSVNGKYKIENIGRDDWIQMAKRTGISGTGLVNRLHEMAGSILRELDDVLLNAELQSASDFKEKYAKCVRENIRILFSMKDLNGLIGYQD